ncbi:hypothetical protein K505DRAFT_244767 [Melanomma pulvis-pyrius CBS 109.77]|uniref:Transmembrane protein n=1 Tax=Melanomma pulvis-pyrius CBS 109.77 TaxID=1314802 RepID=A0A6A6X9P7_9PLEO|nr:hypothetical protein K505DRAFT_244767 [Melanomma pulvis-pyrius CBS 109.77]
MFARNDDALTLRLRSEGPVGIDELINLHRATSPSPVVASSSGTRTTVVFSSREASTATKPTSAGTSYPVENYTGKGKAIATYASSLSATQGSASEAEAEIEATRDNSLFGLGDWTADGPVTAAPLKGFARAGKRQRTNRRPKPKKPEVVIHGGPVFASSDDEGPAVANPATTHRNSRDVKYLRHRRKPEHDQLNLAEEGRLSEATTRSSSPRPLSRARFYVLTSLVIAIVLTFALATFAAHHTGKMRMACTKGIIFSATVLVSCFTVLAMIVARHSLQEALLAGLLEFLVGFALVVEIHDFM